MNIVDGLRIGQPVATLGFPAELQFTGGDADNTVNATFKDGTISALRIQGSGDAEYVEVQYNFNATGGALAAARCSTNTDGSSPFTLRA